MRTKLYFISKLIVVLLCLSTLSATTHAQDQAAADTSSGFMEALEKSKEEIKTFVKEFTDVEMFMHSYQTRKASKSIKIKQLLKGKKNVSDFPLDIDFFVFSDFTLQTFWADALTGKFKFSAEGKQDLDYKPESTSTVDINFYVDSLDTATYTVRTELIVNQYLQDILKLRGEDNFPTTVATEFNNFFADSTYKRPKDAPFYEALEYAYKAFYKLFAPNANNNIEFLPYADQLYGFDVYNDQYSDKWKKHYDVHLLEDSTFYYVPYKSIGKGENAQTDYVLAKINNPVEIDQNSVSFVDDEGKVFDKIKVSDNLYKVILKPEDIGRNLKLSGRIDGVTVGYLQIEAYKEKTANIIVVPVNCDLRFSEAEITSAIDNAFKCANVVSDVKIEARFNNTEWDLDSNNVMLFPEDEDGTIGKYSAEMRLLRKTYFDSIDIVKDSYYLFVLPELGGEESGYMVRGKALGFIDNGDLVPIKTYPHELGHGIFGLKHTFSEGMGEMSDSINNLMDYSLGFELAYKQWEKMHSVWPIISMFDDLDEGAGFYADIKLSSNLMNSDSTYTFLTPGATFITLPKSLCEVKVFTADPLYSQTQMTDIVGAIGTLSAFSLKQKDGNKLRYTIREQNNSIKYRNEDNKKYVDSISENLEKLNPIAILPYRENGLFRFVAYKLFKTDDLISNNSIVKLNNPATFGETDISVSSNFPKKRSDFNSGNGFVKNSFSILELLYDVNNEINEVNNTSLINIPCTTAVRYLEWKNFFESRNGEEVEGTFPNKFSQLALDFLDDFSFYTDRGNPSGPVTISSAFWFDRYVNLSSFITCNVSSNDDYNHNFYGDNIVNFDELSSIVWQEHEVHNSVMYTVPEAEGFTISEETLFQESKPDNSFNLYHALKNQTSKLKQGDTLLKKLKSHLLDFDETVENNDLIILIKKIEEDVPCLLEEITLDQRVKLISFLEINNEEDLIILLINTASYNSQATALVNQIFVEDNGALFYKLWDRIQNGIFDDNFDVFIESLVNLSVASYDNLDDRKQISIGLDITPKTDYSFKGYFASTTDNGSLKFIHKYKSTIPALNENGVNTYPFVEEPLFCSYNELVDVTFTSYDSQLRTLAGGDEDFTISMPAFYLKYLCWCKQKKKIHQMTRIMANIVGVLAAIPTGGASLTLTGIEMSVGLVDIVVTVNEDKLSQSEIGREFMSVWHDISLLVLPMAVVNSGAKGIVRRGSSVKRLTTFNFENLFNELKNSIEYSREVLKLPFKDTKAYELLSKLKSSIGSIKLMGETGKAVLFNAKLVAKLEAEMFRLRMFMLMDDASLFVKDNILVNVKVGSNASVNIAELKPGHEAFYLKTKNEIKLDFHPSDEAISSINDVDYFYNSAVKNGDLTLVRNLDESTGKYSYSFVARSSYELANAGSGFAKLSTKSSLSTSLFNSLDNALASAPSIKFNYGSKTLQSPKQFLNATGNDMYDIVLSNGAYAKFDNATGRMLYSEGGNNFFVRYADDGVNVLNVESFVNGKVTQLKKCVGLNGSQTVNLISEVGGPITASSSRVTTFVGKTTETQLLKDQFGNFKHIEIGETAGSINLLNMPDTYFNGTTWWVDHNRAWMQRAISRGDDIYIASPLKNIDMSIDNILVSQQYGPSYYARELNELVKIDYKPINISSSEWLDVKNLINSIFE